MRGSRRSGNRVRYLCWRRSRRSKGERYSVISRDGSLLLLDRAHCDNFQESLKRLQDWLRGEMQTLNLSYWTSECFDVLVQRSEVFPLVPIWLRHTCKRKADDSSALPLETSLQFTLSSVPTFLLNTHFVTA